MKLLLAVLAAMLLAGCTTTVTRYVPVKPVIVAPAEPRPIVCPPAKIVKESDQRFVIDGQGHANLISCRSDTVRWVQQARSVMQFYKQATSPSQQ